MNTWSYLILIAALCALAAFMLYARFSSRSRGKLLHHSLRDISPDQFDRSDFGAVEDPSSEISEMFTEDNDTTKREIRQPNSAITAEPIPSDHHEEEEYLDELQEAAAGLAMLMRSSPVQDRTSPVVFAPEEEALVESEVEETILIPKEENIAEDSSEPEDIDAEVAEEALDSVPAEPTDEIVLQIEGSEVIASESEEPLAETMEEAIEVRIEKSRLSLAEIVGDEVAEKFSQIDENLEALEGLVSGVESRLSAWDSESDADWNPSSTDSSSMDDEAVAVGEAA